MSKLGAIDRVYILGMNEERSRVRDALRSYLKDNRNWLDGEVDSVFAELKLSKNEYVLPTTSRCGWCNETANKEVVVYGQVYHETCWQEFGTLSDDLGFLDERNEGAEN